MEIFIRCWRPQSYLTMIYTRATKVTEPPSRLLVNMSANTLGSLTPRDPGHGGAKSTISGSNSRAANPDRLIAIKRNTEYPWQLWYFLATLIFIIAVCQFAAFLHAKRPRRRRPSGETNVTELKPSPHPWSPRQIPVALINAYRVIAFRWTINLGHGYTLNLAEVALSCAYVIALFTWAFINTTDVRGIKYANRYWSNRTGTLAASQLPLMTALGTKNNVISWLTGVTYDKLNYLHRMTSRVVFVLIWVHAAGRLQKGIPMQEWTETWLWTGMLGGVAFAVLCLVSVRPVRAKAYEFFFYMHFVLVLTFLIGSFYHTKQHKFDSYIIACFVIWTLDRFIRAIRLLVFNHSYFGLKTGSGTLDASAELISESLVRLTMRRPSHFHWSPGQTAYLIMPSVSTLPFEAHPFTIASFDSSSEYHTRSAEETLSQDKSVLGDSARYWRELVFLINIQEGCTRRLAKVAAQSGTIKVFVDGPYGPSPDLRRFDTCVLIAGGSGISYTLPLFLDVIERVRHGHSVCSQLVFIWSIRDIAHINWVSDTLYRSLLLVPSDLEIRIKIFVTGQRSDLPSWVDNVSVNSTPPDSPSSQKTVEPLALLGIPSIQMFTGRSDLGSILRHEAECTSGRMSVNVCGSQSISNAVRDALRFPISGPSNILQGGPSVMLHVESFGYA